MNEFIKKELEKIRVPYEQDEQKGVIRFSTRFEPKKPTLEVEKCYIIQLSDYVLNEHSNSILSSNWNKGIVPKSKAMQVGVTKILGNMVQIDGTGYDLVKQNITDDVYIGFWLPISEITIICELGVS